MENNLGINFDQLLEIGSSDLSSPVEEKTTVETTETGGDKAPENDGKNKAILADDSIDVTKFFENNDIDTEDKKEIIDDEEEDKETGKTSKAPPQQNKSEESDESSSQVPFHLLFKSLSEEGALTSFDEELYKKDKEEYGEAVAMVNAWEREATAIRESIRQEHEEDFQEYAALKDLGLDTDTAKELISSKVKFDSITPEELEGEDKVELRKQILIQDYKNSTNLSDARIEKLVNKSIESGTDEEDAKEAIDNIKKFNTDQIKAAKETKIQEEQQKQIERDRTIKTYKEFIQGLDEPIEGVKMNKPNKEKLEKNVLSGYAWELRKQDPVKFDTMVTYAVMNGLLDGKFDKASKSSKTKAIKELENTLKTSKNKEVKPSQEFTEQSVKDDDVMLSGLEQIRKQVSKF